MFLITSKSMTTRHWMAEVQTSEMRITVGEIHRLTPDGRSFALESAEFLGHVAVPRQGLRTTSFGPRISDQIMHHVLFFFCRALHVHCLSDPPLFSTARQLLHRILRARLI